MPTKPLRFLYRKYAGHAPPKGGANEVGASTTTCYKYGSLQSQQHNSDSLGQLHQLGRELTKRERIQMYFDLSDGVIPNSGQPYYNSSVGSAGSTRDGRSINSKKEYRSAGVSPSRYRSKSQEFQSKFKLAISRSSPEHKPINQSLVTQLPHLHKNGGNNVTNGHLVNTGDNLDTHAHTQSSSKQGCRNRIPAINQSNLRIPTGIEGRPQSAQNTLNQASSNANLRGILPQTTNTVNSQRPRERFPRCLSGSTIDVDRIDSSQYQYLLDGFSNFSSSESLGSVKSDPASSHFSARAQRPSTTATSHGTQRLRDLQTCTTVATPRTKSRHNSYNNKSPENQWPPRYAMAPSWPSYEDINRLNSCGEHRNLMSQLYKRDNRRPRERNNKNNVWNGCNCITDGRLYPIHVVPSHTNMECTMCNLYSYGIHPTLCPPNSPLVISHDDHNGQPQQQQHQQHKQQPHHHHHHDHHQQQQEQQQQQQRHYQSGLGSSASLRVNHSSANQSSYGAGSSDVNSSSYSPQKLTRSADSNMRVFSFPKVEDKKAADADKQHYTVSFTKPFLRSPLQSPLNMKKSNLGRVNYVKSPQRDVSYSWDTCKFSYVKANG